MLTESEKEVSGEDLVALEQSKQNVNFAFTLNPLIQQYINYYQGPRGQRYDGKWSAPLGTIYEAGASDLR